MPRDHWLEPWEKVAIINFHHQCPREGYRRLTFMMLDRNVVAVSPSSTYRVLKAAGLLQRWNPKPSGKGNGFQQPLEPHEHWHVDISYLNIAGTFFYLCSVLDGCSEFPVALGIAHRDDGARRRDRLAASSRKISGYFPADHYRQRAAVYCQGLQGVYPPGRADPCQNLPLLPAKQTGKSSDGTRASKSIFSGQAVRSPSRMALDLSSVSLPITTPCGCTRPSAMLSRLVGSPAATSRSSSSEIANSNSLAKTEKLNDNP